MGLFFPDAAGPTKRHRLDPARIIETAEDTVRNVRERYPGSSLAGLAVELAEIARATEEQARYTRRPIYAMRAASVLAITASLVGLWYLGAHLHTRWEFGTITEVFEAADAGFNLLVLLAGALWFFVTLEARIKRRRVLASLEELREFVHVIDVTQLYYTPDLLKANHTTSRSSLDLDYMYLLVCAQMLGVISNLAPLYARGAAGDSILRAVSELESFANATSAKILSKADTVRGAAITG